MHLEKDLQIPFAVIKKIANDWFCLKIQTLCNCCTNDCLLESMIISKNCEIKTFQRYLLNLNLNNHSRCIKHTFIKYRFCSWWSEAVKPVAVKTIFRDFRSRERESNLPDNQEKGRVSKWPISEDTRGHKINVLVYYCW